MMDIDQYIRDVFFDISQKQTKKTMRSIFIVIKKMLISVQSEGLAELGLEERFAVVNKVQKLATKELRKIRPKLNKKTIMDIMDRALQIMLVDFSSFYNHPGDS